MDNNTWRKLNIVCLTLLACLFSVTASADVIGAMSAVSTEMIGWVQTGAIIVVIISAIAVATGRASLLGLAGLIIGLAVAAQPETFANLITRS